MKNPIRLSFTLAVLATLGACTSPLKPKVDMVDTPVVRPQAVAPPVVNNGSIFQAGQYRPLFEDHRARLVGDTLTVQIVEKVTASQKSTSTVDKTGKLSGSISALPFVKPKAFARASAAGESGNSVPSAQIANVRIEQRGRGAQADAQGIGWLGRFFLSVLPI